MAGCACGKKAASSAKYVVTLANGTQETKNTEPEAIAFSKRNPGSSYRRV